MTAESDHYAVLAKYYDGAYAAMTDLIDVPFYLELAKRIGGPVLEIGCGTGRVLLPIARAGITIDGIDSSLSMTGILQQKIEREAPNVSERILLPVLRLIDHAQRVPDSKTLRYQPGFSEIYM